MEDKITQGKWEQDDANPEMIYCKGGDGVYNYILDTEADSYIHTIETSECIANAKAICRAVNNTYGKGIDPEKIGRLISFVKDKNFKCLLPTDIKKTLEEVVRSIKLDK